MTRRFTLEDIPNTRWPSDNEWDIPSLDLGLQARVLDLPLRRWGGEARGMHGTWHFYTGDAKFDRRTYRALAASVLSTQAVAVVEPNYSVTAATPRAEALWATYRKRWLARLWQSHGLRVVVDLFVATEHKATNLLGLEFGWSSFATRGSSRHLEGIERDYDTASYVARGKPSLFLVYGGGKAVRQLCQERGWLHEPEELDTKPWAALQSQSDAAVLGAPSGDPPQASAQPTTDGE